MSNATQKPSHARTKSAPKYWLLLLFSAVLAVIIGCVVLLRFCTRSESSLQFGTQRLVYETAVSPAERERGLSGRSSLAADHAMLFVFEQEGRHCFWMKDMRFDLDIVWLSADGTALLVRDHVSPATYPAEFCPNGPAKYVVEVNAGVAARAGIQVGSKINIP